MNLPQCSCQTLLYEVIFRVIAGFLGLNRNPIALLLKLVVIKTLYSITYEGI
jgi:hypothetical protein